MEVEIERFEKICAEFYSPEKPIVEAKVSAKKERPKVPPKPKFRKPNIIRSEETPEGTEV